MVLKLYSIRYSYLLIAAQAATLLYFLEYNNIQKKFVYYDQFFKVLS